MKELFIDQDSLLRNFRVVQQQAGNACLMAVLKSDAYGLGLIPMANFWREQGVTRFGIGDPSEAVILRKEGFQEEELLLLRSTAVPEEIETLLDHRVVATVGSQEAAVALSGLAEKRSTIAEVHIKIDCGFGRYGFLPGETDKIKSVYQYLNAVAVSGVYTHIPPGLSKKKAAAAKASFDGLLAFLRSEGLETGLTHALGSSALFAYPSLQSYGMVRVGAAISGRVPGKNGLKRVGIVSAPIADIRWIPPRHTISKTLRLRKPARIGLVPLGYAAGFAVISNPSYRSWRMGAAAARRPAVKLATGEEARVLGHVGQNHMAIDLTHIQCTVGTLVQVEIDPLFAGALPRVFR